MTAQKITLPTVRRVLTSDWNVHNPEKCVKLIESLKYIYPTLIIDELIDMIIQPKINNAVKLWNPKEDLVPIHFWIFPWLPLLKSKLSIYYSDIRRKLGLSLLLWQPTDTSAYTIILPWKNVFDKTSMDNFLIRTIIPKLIIGMKSIVINPGNQEINLFQNIIAWNNVIPTVHMISILCGEFFNKWLRVLINWLMINPDFTEVSEWYSGWKSLFPINLLEELSIMEYFNTALNLMNIVLMSEDEVECRELLQKESLSLPDTSYHMFLEKKLNEIKMKERLDELNKNERYSKNTTAGAPYTLGTYAKSFLNH